MTAIIAVVVAPALLLAADADSDVRARIVGAYQAALDALRAGDADAALSVDTEDWVSITLGQKPRTKKELEPYVRRDIASMKPPDGWKATWRPDYERRGIAPGIQVYDLQVQGDTAIALCLVGSTRRDTIDGVERTVWTGSHVRDTWVNTPAGWKRSKHEKLTVNERIVEPSPRETR